MKYEDNEKKKPLYGSIEVIFLQTLFEMTMEFIREWLIDVAITTWACKEFHSDMNVLENEYWPVRFGNLKECSLMRFVSMILQNARTLRITYIVTYFMFQSYPLLFFEI